MIPGRVIPHRHGRTYDVVYLKDRPSGARTYGTRQKIGRGKRRNRNMNWHTDILLAASILAAASLSCHGPETVAFNSNIIVESNKSSPTQGCLGTETTKSEIEAKVLKSKLRQESRVDRMRREEELIMLDGIAASFL
jgi:hypothetical protein